MYFKPLSKEMINAAI